GEPQDRVVVGMTAGDSLFRAAPVFDSDAGTVADPFFDLGATLFGKTRVDRGAPGEPVFVSLQNLEDCRVVRIWGKRRLQCPTDLLGDGPLDTHAFDKEIVLLILLDGVLGGEAVEMIVPNPIGNQLVPRGESVIGRVDEKLAWRHIILRAALGYIAR